MFEQLKNPAPDDLHPALPPATASSLARTWHQAQKSQRGFRESVARTPQGEIPQIEVSAWVQIPYVLQRLGAGPVKVVFPPGQDDAARAEQAGIKEFLRSRHRTSFELLFPLIEDQIASSASFAALDLMPPDIIKSAQDWLEAHQLRGYSERILRATDLLSAPGTPGAPLADFKSRAATAIAEHLSSNRPLVFTVPAGADCVAIAESLQGVCNESSEGERAKGTVRVWTPTGAGDTHSLVECSLGNFIDTSLATAPAAADTAAPSAAESAAPSGSEQAVPNNTGEDSQILQQVDFGEEPENEATKQALPAVPEQDAGTGESAPGVGEASNTDVLANSQTATVGHFLDAANLATAETEPQVAVAGSPSSSENAAQPQVASAGELLDGGPLARVVEWVDSQLKIKPQYRAKTVVDFARRLAMARASRKALDVEAPKHETTYLCSEGGHTELAPKAGRAQEILKEVAARSMHESADLLFRALEHFERAREQAYNPNLSTQMGDLVLLPNKGHALFFSDLEGQAAKLAELIDRYDLIERWERNEPVFLCILGDCVDRSHNGSLLIDFLLDLKLRHGFERHVVLVPGNHELSVNQNLENLFGGDDFSQWLDRDVKWTLVSDIFNRDFSGSNEPSEERQTNKTLESLCPQSALAFVGSQTEMDEATYRSRWGLYVLYQSVFQMMPKVIYSVNGLYSTHAGLPRHGAFEEIFQADTPIVPDPKKWFSLLTEVRCETDCERLIWDDLATKFGEKGEFIPQDDPRRMAEPSRPQFTLNDFNRFCDATGLSLMIRGHQNTPSSSKIKSNYPEKESIKSAGHGGRFYSHGWNVGNIVTVSHFEWGALLDLSIPKPQAQDVKWIINVERKGTAYRVLPKLPPISTDPDDLSREEWFQNLDELPQSGAIDNSHCTAGAAADTAAPSAAESAAPSGSEPAVPNGETGEDSEILQQVDFGEEPENEATKQALPAVPEQDAGTGESAPGVGEASNTDVLVNPQAATEERSLDAATVAAPEAEPQVAGAGSASSSDNAAQPQVATASELLDGGHLASVVGWVDSHLKEETQKGAKTVIDFARRLAMARASRKALDVEAPKYKTTYLYSEGGRTELSPKAGRAQEILKEVAARSIDESADLLFRALEHFERAREQAYNPNLSTQMGDLVLLPNKGHALFFSDLEGDAAKLAELIDRYDLIERWERNEPVFLCILGDCVDRSHNGSLLIDFLLDLKLRRGFERHVVLVPGNHELSVDQNLENLTGGRDGFDGVRTELKWTLVSDIFNRDYYGSQELSEERQTIKTLESLCPQSALAFVSSQAEMDEATYRSRWGLYVLYLSVFQVMPKVIYSVNGLYSTHAGLPRRGAFEEIFQADTPVVPDPKRWFSLLTEVSCETDCQRLIWDDLATKFGEKGEFVPQDDPRRMSVRSRPQFTLNDFNRFCDATGLSLMIRGHQNRPFAHKVNYPELESIKSAGCDRRFHWPGWNVGNIVTVSHFKWGALLDLSIEKPTAKDVKWVITDGESRSVYNESPENGTETIYHYETLHRTLPPIPPYAASAEVVSGKEG